VTIERYLLRSINRKNDRMEQNINWAKYMYYLFFYVVKNINKQNTTECIPDLDLEAAWAVMKIGLSQKPNHHREILPKLLIRSIYFFSRHVILIF